MLGNFEREGRAEIGGEGSETNELFADITNGLRNSGTELDCTEGHPNKLFEDFCFVGGLKFPWASPEERWAAFWEVEVVGGSYWPRRSLKAQMV